MKHESRNSVLNRYDFVNRYRLSKWIRFCQIGTEFSGRRQDFWSQGGRFRELASSPRRRRMLDILQRAFKKISKNALLSLFFKKFKTLALNLRSLGRKTKLVGKQLKFFYDNSLENLHFQLILKNRAFCNNNIFSVSAARIEFLA